MTPRRPSLHTEDPPGITRRAALQGAGVLALATALGVGATAPAAAAGPTTDAFVALCEAQRGKQYVWGTAGPNTFDCSGLIHWALARLGVTSQHQSAKLINITSAISVDQGIRTRGALLYRPGHIAVSLGNGRTIEAANEKLDVLSLSAHGRGWTRAGLVPQLTQAIPPTPPAPVPVPDVQEDDMRGLIEALYRRYLGRVGTPAEIDDWTISAAVGARTGAQVVDTFLSGRAEPSTVIAAYQEFLGRTPGESEIASWLQSQPSIRQVRDGVAGSPEAS